MTRPRWEHGWLTPVTHQEHGFSVNLIWQQAGSDPVWVVGPKDARVWMEPTRRGPVMAEYSKGESDFIAKLGHEGWELVAVAHTRWFKRLAL